MVSFGSNYRFNIGSNFPNDVVDKLWNYEFRGVELRENYTSFEEASKTGIYATMTVTAPDKFDGEIETLLLSRGIDFHKQTFDEALDIKNIKNRIQVSADDRTFGYQLVVCKTDILNELFKKDGVSYIEPQGKNGLGERYKGVGEYLKTGEKIDATKVHFSEVNGELVAMIEDGRHRFAYMRDLGMQSMPIAIDEASYEIASKYGLIL